jgi:hypothetical protein
MENKIITEEDFWRCSCGLMPAPFQSGQKLVYTNNKVPKKYITRIDKSTLSWIDFGCTKLMLLYAVLAAIAAAIAALCVATGGAALIAICAIAGAVGAAWGAVVGSLICGHLVAMTREWMGWKDDFKILGIETITGDKKMMCNALTFIGVPPGEISYVPNVKSWGQALALGVANFIGKVFEGMMAGACIGAVAAAGAAIATGASSGGIAGVGRVVWQFAKSVPKNFLINAAESISGIGLAMRGTMTTQSMLATYGELGEETTKEDMDEAALQGFFGMEIGTYESAKNIATGSGTLQDYAGIALAVAPTGKGARDVFPHSPDAQNMGIVPDGFAGKIDADAPQKTVDVDTGKKTNDAETGKKGDDIQVRSQAKTTTKTKGSDGKAYAKGKARYGQRRISDDLYAELRKETPSQAIRDMVNEGITFPMEDMALPGLKITKNLHADHIVPMDKITKMDGFDKLTREQQMAVLNNPNNFVGLSESANCSKGSKSYTEWTEHKSKNVEVDHEFRKNMIEKESQLEGQLQQQIDDFNTQNLETTK